MACVWGLVVLLCAIATPPSVRGHLHSHPPGLGVRADLPRLRELAGKHGIFVGTASNAGTIRKDKKYDEILRDQFSLTTPENACKWGAIHPEEKTFDFKDCSFVVTTAQANNQTVRGHNLCWGVYNPGWLSKYAHNATALRYQLTNHVSTVVRYYRDQMYSWDVVNEAVSDNPQKENYLKHNIWYPTVPDYINVAFKAAHAVDSNIKLFYNDYNCEVINAKSDAIYEMCKAMLAQGIPLHGMGIQAHFSIGALGEVEGTKLASPVPKNWSSVEANIKRFVDLGLEVHITELDVSLHGQSQDLLEQEAAAYKGMLIACLKYAPKCRSFETWGFIDKYSWLSGHAPDYFDDNFKPKPCFFAVAEELNKTISN